MMDSQTEYSDLTELAFNDAPPLIMHIDLNSCYAIIEQQANRLIRNKPVCVAAYDSPGGFIIASSYEAKRLGIKLMRIRDARAISRNIIILTPDPEKYFDAHRRFRRVLEQYTSEVTPKSVDEFVVDFRGSRAVQDGKTLVEIGREIKADIKRSLGEYVTVNIGIATNRFLAKLAAGMDKPDGMDVVVARDIPNLFGQLSLTDLPGINYRYEARLVLAGIKNPLDFLESPMIKLKKQVFNSIVGYYWYMRLRGWEVDAVRFGTRSFGNDYAVGEKPTDPERIKSLIMKLCEKAGRRLRKHRYQAMGVSLNVGFANSAWWGKSMRTQFWLYSTQDIYHMVIKLFEQVPIVSGVSHLRIAVFNVVPLEPRQINMFQNSRLDKFPLTNALDKLNDRYGEYTVIPARMAGMEDVIIKRVPFGSVRDI